MNYGQFLSIIESYEELVYFKYGDWSSVKYNGKKYHRYMEKLNEWFHIANDVLDNKECK